MIKHRSSHRAWAMRGTASPRHDHGDLAKLLHLAAAISIDMQRRSLCVQLCDPSENDRPPLSKFGQYSAGRADRNTRIDAERDIHDAGHVSILKTLHDRLDQEVAAAYGWRPDLTPAEIIARIVALNAPRRAEEEQGIIHWLRPDYQAPTEARAAKQTTMQIEETAEPDSIPTWPKDELQQYMAVRAALAQEPATPKTIAGRFRRAPRARLATVLETLAALGQIHKAHDGSFYL